MRGGGRLGELEGDVVSRRHGRQRRRRLSDLFLLCGYGLCRDLEAVEWEALKKLITGSKPNVWACIMMPRSRNGVFVSCMASLASSALLNTTVAVRAIGVDGLRTIDVSG